MTYEDKPAEARQRMREEIHASLMDLDPDSKRRQTRIKQFVENNLMDSSVGEALIEVEGVRRDDVKLLDKIRSELDSY